MTKKSAAASFFAAAIVLFALLGNAEGGKKTDVYTVCMHLFPYFSQILKRSQLRNFFFRPKTFSQRTSHVHKGEKKSSPGNFRFFKK